MENERERERATRIMAWFALFVTSVLIESSKMQLLAATATRANVYELCGKFLLYQQN